MAEISANERSITPEELELLRWMLCNGSPEAQSYLSQLESVKVSAWRCPCGCASFNLQVANDKQPTGGMKVIADFVYENDGEVCGIFAFQVDGELAGVEVVGYSADAPKSLPNVAWLQAYGERS